MTVLLMPNPSKSTSLILFSFLDSSPIPMGQKKTRARSLVYKEQRKVDYNQSAPGVA